MVNILSGADKKKARIKIKINSPMIKAAVIMLLTEPICSKAAIMAASVLKKHSFLPAKREKGQSAIGMLPPCCIAATLNRLAKNMPAVIKTNKLNKILFIQDKYNIDIFKKIVFYPHPL